MPEVTVTIPDGYKLEPTIDGYKLVKYDTLENILKIERYNDPAISLNYPNFTNCFYKLKVLGELMCVADFLNDGWKPNWDNNDERKWCIVYRHLTEEFDVDYTYNTVYNNTIFFKKKEDAMKAIELIGVPVLEKIFL